MAEGTDYHFSDEIEFPQVGLLKAEHVGDRRFLTCDDCGNRAEITGNPRFITCPKCGTEYGKVP